MNRRQFATLAIGTTLATRFPTAVTAQSTPQATDNPYLYGNAFDLIPEGEPSAVQIVLIGAPVRESVPLVIRNTTDQTIGVEDVTGVARDAAGKLIGTVEVGRAVPHTVEAGGIAIGYAYFGSFEPPADAAFEFEVIHGEPDENIVNFTVIEAERTENQLIGIAENSSGQVAMGPNFLTGLFFDADGTITGYCAAYTDKDEVEDGGTTPFSADFYGEMMTDTYLVGATGWGDF